MLGAGGKGRRKLRQSPPSRSLFLVNHHRGAGAARTIEWDELAGPSRFTASDLLGMPCRRQYDRVNLLAVGGFFLGKLSTAIVCGSASGAFRVALRITCALSKQHTWERAGPEKERSARKASRNDSRQLQMAGARVSSTKRQVLIYTPSPLRYVIPLPVGTDTQSSCERSHLVPQLAAIVGICSRVAIAIFLHGAAPALPWALTQGAPVAILRVDGALSEARGVRKTRSRAVGQLGQNGLTRS
jgi:hypothetical protein